MHDPNTVAFEIPNIFQKAEEISPGHFYREPIITIWHHDPEVGGDDDSCGWIYPRLTDKELDYARELIKHPHDNLHHWFPDVDEDEAESRIMRIFRVYKGFARPWWRHPKWHFWHWRLQFHPYQKLIKLLKEHQQR